VINCSEGIRSKVTLIARYDPISDIVRVNDTIEDINNSVKLVVCGILLKSDGLPSITRRIKMIIRDETIWGYSD